MRLHVPGVKKNLHMFPWCWGEFCVFRALQMNQSSEQSDSNKLKTHALPWFWTKFVQIFWELRTVPLPSTFLFLRDLNTRQSSAHSPNLTQTCIITLFKEELFTNRTWIFVPGSQGIIAKVCFPRTIGNKFWRLAQPSRLWVSHVQDLKIHKGNISRVNHLRPSHIQPQNFSDPTGDCNHGFPLFAHADVIHFHHQNTQGTFSPS